MRLSPRRRYVADNAERPGTVISIRGIVLQSDGRSTVGRMFIRPLEAMDRWMVGILPKPGEPSRSRSLEAWRDVTRRRACGRVAEGIADPLFAYTLV